MPALVVLVWLPLERPTPALPPGRELVAALLAAVLSASVVAVLWSPNDPDTLPLTEYPLALYVLWFSMSLVVRLAVWKLFFFSSMAACVLLMTPPLRSVLPFTLTSKPPSPALMPLCSLTLAWLPLAFAAATLPPTVLTP